MSGSATITTSGRKRLRHRIPRSLRQHWKLLVVFVAFVTAATTVFSGLRIYPYITGDPTIISSEITENVNGTVGLFDASTSHELSIDISAAEYDDMIAAYKDNGEKTWVNADITIDGTFINDASVRLKGNSTLMGLRGKGFGPPELAGAAEDGEAPAGLPPGIPSVNEGDPTSLPLLISFEKNADGRAYQGLTELSVRPGIPVLNESLALSLTADTGQPTQRFTYAVYSINGGATTTRLLLEHPDEYYANNVFDSDGFLYEVDANSELAYVGDDQSDYVNQFKLLNAQGTGDVQPVIAFVKWMDAADDEEFAANLDKWVDTESLTRYIATQHLLANSDDMGGPGQNYYLWYDLESKRLSVISWDLNLAMTGSTESGPHEPISMGTPPGEPNGGPAAAENVAVPAPKGNSLKTRFQESEAFADRYEAEYWELYEQIYGSGRADAVLDSIAARVPLSESLTADRLADEVDAMRKWIQQRTAALAAHRDE